MFCASFSEMPLQLCCVLFALLAIGSSHPVEQSSIGTLAKYYAKLHPITDAARNPIYGNHYQGDILLPSGNGKETLSADRTRRWPLATVYYSITDNLFSTSEVTEIKAAIADIQKLTTVKGLQCIKFVPRYEEPNYINIEQGNGCSSYVGMQGGRQAFSLEDGCVERGTILHELMHAVGFHHEQSRTDRDDFITINWDNIEPDLQYNFDKIARKENNPLGTRYDYGSLMHCDANAFAVDPSIPTIIPRDPSATIGQRKSLSPIDIERVQILYGCIKASNSKYFSQEIQP